MGYERRPELLYRIDNMLGWFFINPKALINMADEGRLVGVVWVRAMVRLKCGALVETRFRLLASASDGVYRELPPKLHDVACPACGKIERLYGRQIVDAITEVEGRELDYEFSERRMAAMRQYHEFGKEAVA